MLSGNQVRPVYVKYRNDQCENMKSIDNWCEQTTMKRIKKIEFDHNSLERVLFDIKIIEADIVPF